MKDGDKFILAEEWPHRYHPFLLKNLRLSKMTLALQVIWIFSIILASSGFCMANLNVTYEWKYIEYVRDSCIDEKAYSIAMQSYDYTKIIPSDIQPLPDGRILVTTPKLFDNPPSLSTISNQTGDGGPLLAPYPNWSWHNRKDCSGITSVNKVFLDDCNRLWVVDAGKIENEMVCPAKILAFDPENDKLIKELIIPTELTHNVNNKNQGRLEISGVETYGKSCERTWVYISDVEGFGLVIWDGYDIWRLNDEVFNPDPDQTNITIAGINFTLNIGLIVFYITPEGYLKNRAVLFKALSSVDSYAVTLEDLHHSKLGSEIIYYKINFPVPSQEQAGAYSKRDGILIATFPTQTVIACWNLQYPLNPQTISYLVVDETTLQFVSAIKTTQDSQSRSQTVWVFSNKYQRFASGTMDWTEINFRILTGDVDTLVSGTVCEPLPEYDVTHGVEDKNFFYYKTETDDLYKSYRLRDDTDTCINRFVSGPLEECDVENGSNDQEEEFNETPTDALSGSCRLIRI